MAEQEEDVQNPLQSVRLVSIVLSPPQLKPHPLLQEDIHKLVHTPEHAELPQPTPHVVKQPLVQLVKHQPEHP